MKALNILEEFYIIDNIVAEVFFFTFSIGLN